MTATEIAGLIAQLTTSIVAIIAAWAAYKAGVKVDTLQATTEVAAKSSDEKLGVIHELTNSTLTGVRAELEMANGKINELQKMVVRMASNNRGPTEAEGLEAVDSSTNPQPTKEK